MLKHTFILEEGVWKASGLFYDEGNNAFTLEAEARTVHYDEEWIHEGSMFVKSEKPLEINNRYEIIPFPKNKDFTNWVQFNPSLGIITGKFMIVDNVILSNYQSETGEYTGTEVLIQIDAKTYLNKGFALRGNTKLSSWATELQKQD